jgi:CMP/dCMP kinase
MAPESPLTIAIDGPSGAGKGTVARAIAAHLGYHHVDTGAMYRAVAWKALHEGLPLDDETAMGALAERVFIEATDGVVRIDGHDVAHAIRTPEIDRAAAAAARLPRVRAALVARQRKLGEGGRVVMEGRDVGTVIFPGADVKVFLDASPGERARRRASDPAHTGGREGSLTSVASELEARDAIDRTRSASPLTVAPDATCIDTTTLTIEEVVARVLQVVEGRERGN